MRQDFRLWLRPPVKIFLCRINAAVYGTTFLERRLHLKGSSDRRNQGD